MIQSTNILVVLAFGLVILFLPAAFRDEDEPAADSITLEDLVSSAANEEPADESDSDTNGRPAQSFSVQVRKPSGPPVVELPTGDPLGRVGKVACSTCHSVREPNLANRDAASLDEFHQGLKVSHGKLACYACHHPDDADSLRSAEGTKIAYEDVMTLCSQCHGPQATSFARGAHGGMTGFWDLSRRPQVKNNCIDCHDPHTPSFPKMIVDFKPRDRFLEGGTPHDDHE